MESAKENNPKTDPHSPVAWIGAIAEESGREVEVAENKFRSRFVSPQGVVQCGSHLGVVGVNSGAVIIFQ